MHQFCPEGLDSWCKWQLVQARKPGPYVHHDVVPKAVFDEVRPIYVRLADRQLLERCSEGATQNANEAFNRMIWHLCPKESFCSAQTMKTAVDLSILSFNEGGGGGGLLQELQCLPASYTAAALEQWDMTKEYHGKRKRSDDEKRSRRRRRAKKKGFIDAAVEREGCTYGAGQFGV